MTEANKAYEAIELAKKTGKIKKGINEVTKTIERSSAKLVILAKDVSPAEIILHIKPLCEEKSIPCVEIPSKEELGAAAGLRVPTSAISIIKEGEAKDIINSLTKETPKEKPKEIKDETTRPEEEKKG